MSDHTYNVHVNVFEGDPGYCAAIGIPRNIYLAWWRNFRGFNSAVGAVLQVDTSTLKSDRPSMVHVWGFVAPGQPAVHGREYVRLARDWVRPARRTHTRRWNLSDGTAIQCVTYVRGEK